MGKLTQRQADAVRCKGAEDEVMIADGDGLYLRARRTTKAWWFIYGPRANRQRFILGEYDQVVDPDTGKPSLAAARKLARAQLAMIAKDEGDPATKARAQAKARTNLGGKTFGALLDAYVDDLEQRASPSTMNARSAFSHVGPALRAIPARHVQRPDIAGLIRSVQAKKKPDGSKYKYAPKGVLAYVSAAFSRAMKAADGTNETVSTSLADFGITANPCLGIDTGITVGVKERALNLYETHAWYRALKAEPAGDVRDLMLLALLLGGQRLVQVGYARIGADKQDRPVLEMFDAKQVGAGRPHVVPLAGEALALVKSRTPLHLGQPVFGVDQAHAYVLQNRTYSHCQRILERVRAADTKVEPFTIGNIRSTATTLMSEILKVPREDYNALQSNNQSNDVDEKHYNKYRKLDEKRAALARWEALITSPPTATRTRGDKVVRLPTAHRAA